MLANENFRKNLFSSILLFLTLGFANLCFAQECPNLSVSTSYNTAKWQIVPVGTVIPNTNNTFTGATWNIALFGIGCTYTNRSLPFPYTFTLFTLNWYPKPITEGSAWVMTENKGTCSNDCYVNCPFTDSIIQNPKTTNK